MIRPIATLDMFVFSPAVGSYEEFEERWKFTWAKPDPIGSSPVMQWMGPGLNTIRIRGGIWPEIQPAGSIKIEAIAARAGRGRALSLRLGNGLVQGRWCVEELTKKGSEFFSDVPAAIEFEIVMSKHNGGGKWPI